MPNFNEMIELNIGLWHFFICFVFSASLRKEVRLTYPIGRHIS